MRYINKFWTQRIKLEIAAEEAFLSAGNDEDTLQHKMHKLAEERSQELDKIIETFSEESVSNIGIPIAETHA